MTASRIGPYRLIRRLGEGGMGVVWAAEDERLGRTVAIKTLSSAGDAAARDRLWREARTAASVSHPNVCQLFDVLDDGGELYLAMELLEGESLSERLERGPLGVEESVHVCRSVLDALAALHARGIVHRDLKPSNVFQTPHGVKVLDFGLALDAEGEELRLTSPGALVGTPRYMAPEQWRGEEVTPATDIFACGALLFEMLAGRPAFDGATAASVCHAALFGRPPALTGSARIESLSRVVDRAMAKDPGDRWATAGAMAEALAHSDLDTAQTRTLSSDDVPTRAGARVETTRRLLVLPFRFLRPDPEAGFLAFGLADAITVALGGIPSLVLRSPLAAGTLAESPDLQEVAREADVDAVLAGTLLSFGGRVRLSAQLIEAGRGTVLASTTAESSLQDLFRLQDELTSAVVDALALTLSPQQDHRVHAPAPGGKAYELYLRANDLGATITSKERLLAARDLYREALDEDPGLAPAWARLGRIYRVMAKYYEHDDEADAARSLANDAFERAFRLDPDLPLAHDLYTYLEVEEPGGAPRAVRRLLGRVRAGAAGPEVFGGLVVACRFCGLLDASVAAHEEARRRDPRARTSVHYTWLLGGDLEKAAAEDRDEIPAVRLCALAQLGRSEEARREWHELRGQSFHGHERLLVETFLASLEGRSETVRAGARELFASGFHDPEGFHFWGRVMVHGGVPEAGLAAIERAVSGGFHFPRLADDPWLEPLHGDPRFLAAVETCRAGHEQAARLFREADGPRLLGLEGRE